MDKYEKVGLTVFLAMVFLATLLGTGLIALGGWAIVEMVQWVTSQ